jgi:hypothetical protein
MYLVFLTPVSPFLVYVLGLQTLRQLKRPPNFGGGILFRISKIDCINSFREESWLRANSLKIYVYAPSN